MHTASWRRYSSRFSSGFFSCQTSRSFHRGYSCTTTSTPAYVALLLFSALFIRGRDYGEVADSLAALGRASPEQHPACIQYGRMNHISEHCWVTLGKPDWAQSEHYLVTFGKLDWAHVTYYETPSTALLYLVASPILPLR